MVQQFIGTLSLSIVSIVRKKIKSARHTMQKKNQLQLQTAMTDENLKLAVAYITPYYPCFTLFFF